MWNLATGAVTLSAQTGLPLTDIAMDPGGRLFGITSNALYRIDPATGNSIRVGPLETLEGELYYGVSALTDATGFDISPTGIGRISSGNNEIIVTVNLETGHVSNDIRLMYGVGGSVGDLWYITDTNYWIVNGRYTLAEIGPSGLGSEQMVSDVFIGSNTVDALIGAPSGSTISTPGTPVGFVGRTAYELAPGFSYLPGLATLSLDGDVTGATVPR
jgi:hypothetical protein